MSRLADMEEIEEILKESRTVAVVGLSAKPDRPSHKVAKYLQAHGYRIIPVNPNGGEVLGEKVYTTLSSITEKVDIVDIFRRSEEVLPVVEEAIRIGARAVWMQENIVNEEAAQRARDAGLKVVMDRCLKKEHKRLHSE
jgi:predicted CoA-binding protein